MTQIFYPSPNHPIHWNWITLVGPDSQDFLHRVTTVNTKSLPIGKGASGCFLTPQGKIRVYFKLWRFSSDAYSFEFDSGADHQWKTDLLAALEEYTFSEKMTVTDFNTEWASCWIFTPLNDKPMREPQETTFTPQEGIRICHQGNEDYGRQWLTAWGKPEALRNWIDENFPNAEAASFQEIETWRVQSLRPRVDREITGTVVPLEIGLRNAIAENKGCYPGQEVIEKIISLGSPPRRLARIEGHGMPPQAGDRIFNGAEPPVEIGQITSIAQNSPQDDLFLALGLIKKIHAKEGLQVRFSDSQAHLGQIQGAIVKIAP